jgi:hypothetical protein
MEREANFQKKERNKTKAAIDSSLLFVDTVCIRDLGTFCFRDLKRFLKRVSTFNQP